MKPDQSLIHRFERRLETYQDASLTVFLVALCLLAFVILPVVELSGRTGAFISFAFSLVFMAGALIGGLSVGWRRFAIALACLSIALSWLEDLPGAKALDLANLAVSILFMAFVCWQLLREVFRPGDVNAHRLRGAVAVYLVVGFIFALIYGFVEALAPGSFRGLGPEGFGEDLHHAMYFSFVTLTTLGYGDITPESEFAQMLVVVEAVVGQLFLAVLIGRLVSLSVPSRASTESSAQADRSEDDTSAGPPQRRTTNL
ncbi:MAG: ion channel [Acidobacteriota bacterium]